MRCHLERKPDGLGDGCHVGVDGDSEQFGRAVWQEEDECLQSAMASPGRTLPATADSAHPPPKVHF